MQTTGIFPENNIRAGINLESTSIRGFKLGVSVGAGENNLLGLDQVADIEGPRLGITQHRNLSGHGENLGCGSLRHGEKLGRADLYGGGYQQPANQPVDATQPHKVNE